MTTLATAGAALLAGLAVGLLAGRSWWLSRARSRSRDAVAHATETMRADVARRQRLEDLLRAREAELGAYARELAARLRAPLAEVCATAVDAQYALLDDDRPAATELVAEVTERCDQLDRLVADLLLYADVSELTLRQRQVDLDAVARAAVRSLAAEHPDAPSQVEVGALPHVLGDPALLSFVLTRIIENALLNPAPGAEPDVLVTASLTGSGEPARQWRVEVRDRGPGVPERDRARLFDPFWTDGPGTIGDANRLSLSLCRRIVERHDGRIGIEPRTGGGSVVWLSLPARVERRAHERVPVPGRVTLRCALGLWHGEVVNLSDGGLRAAFPARPAVSAGEAVDVEVEVDGQSYVVEATVQAEGPRLPATQLRVRFRRPDPALGAAARRAAGVVVASGATGTEPRLAAPWA